MTTSIVPDLATKVVRFLTGSQGLYGDETLRPVAEQSRQVAALLDDALPVRVEWMPVLTSVWKPRPSYQTSATAWLTAGAAHHTVLTTAATAEMFEDFARIVETELLLIDGETTVRGFEHQVRWNNAYYRLAQGF
ncbi:hypothetical protein ACQP1P_16100 [Dactylosporangium sp. CA-052675]|uniref:hypothetical protein n=1 Tax=Dactylosporangium sp. CA-052675 TaxID=3239927 RepID=UPI003D931B72